MLLKQGTEIKYVGRKLPERKGDRVCHGAPALLDKHARTEMALKCGADLVLEIPTVYAVSSADGFATGGVSLLHRLGVVTQYTI